MRPAAAVVLALLLAGGPTAGPGTAQDLPTPVAIEERPVDEAEPPAIAPGALTIDIPAPDDVVPGTSNPALTDVEFVLGAGIRLKQPYIAEDQAPEGCIEKPAQEVRYCVDPVDWPEPLAAALGHGTPLYAGSRAIIRYDSDIATQAHILFPSGSFIAVVEHLQELYGPPTEQEIIWVPMLEAPRLANIAARWVSEAAASGAKTYLEVRSYDNVRRSYPDMNHGFVWLHGEGDQPVFRHLSMVDLMVLRKRHLSLWPLSTTPSN